MTRNQYNTLNGLFREAGWLGNARRGIAVAFTSDAEVGTCGMVTFRFGEAVARAMVAGEMPVPAVPESATA